MDAGEIYVRLGNLIAEMPDLKNYKDSMRPWISKALVLVEKAGTPIELKRMQDAAASIRGYPHIYHAAFSEVLSQCLARAELNAPAAVSGAFIPAGNALDAMAAVGKVLKEAKAEVLIVDPYMDETILTDFAVMLPDGRKLRLLTDAATVKASLKPAVQRWIAQHGSSRPIEARTSPARALHDRLILVDGKTAWTLTQSFKDLAARSPASIIRVAADIAALKLPAYDDMWQVATPI